MPAILPFILMQACEDNIFMWNFTRNDGASVTYDVSSRSEFEEEIIEHNNDKDPFFFTLTVSRDKRVTELTDQSAEEFFEQ